MKPIDLARKMLGRSDIPREVQIVMSTIPSDTDINRRNAARIIHVIMRDIFHVQDIRDDDKLMEAEKLRDLYDCRSCVASIRQVYARGVMGAKYDLESENGRCMIFGGGDLLEEDDIAWEVVINAIDTHLGL
ncbi:hypothetical protein [Eubacterium xylanophilum]|uniref:hypothetical protein n=1 Tax=Eubacterium xylanophilum TaxID=39497 RepID=UPI00047A4032|nr:hypothetical protein [Eubacterium xylanophilum]